VSRTHEPGGLVSLVLATALGGALGRRAWPGHWTKPFGGLSLAACKHMCPVNVPLSTATAPRAAPKCCTHLCLLLGKDVLRDALLQRTGVDDGNASARTNHACGACDGGHRCACTHQMGCANAGLCEGEGAGQFCSVARSSWASGMGVCLLLRVRNCALGGVCKLGSVKHARALSPLPPQPLRTSEQQRWQQASPHAHAHAQPWHPEEGGGVSYNSRAELPRDSGQPARMGHALVALSVGPSVVRVGVALHVHAHAHASKLARTRVRAWMRACTRACARACVRACKRCERVHVPQPCAALCTHALALATVRACMRALKVLCSHHACTGRGTGDEPCMHQGRAAH